MLYKGGKVEFCVCNSLLSHLQLVRSCLTTRTSLSSAVSKPLPLSATRSPLNSRQASVAGHHLANALASTIPSTHRILVVDANAYSYWAPAALRGAVVPGELGREARIRGAAAETVAGWEDKLVAPNTTATFFAKNTHHQVIAPNKVVELKENSVVLEKPFEGSTELPFFVSRACDTVGSTTETEQKCVLATGAVQPAPMRPAVGSSLEETKSTLRKLQQDIASSSKIVIIGGGAVGAEIAGVSAFTKRLPERCPDTRYRR